MQRVEDQEKADHAPDWRGGRRPPGVLLMRLAWLPIPLLLVAIIAGRVAGLRESYESHALTLVLSFTFYTLVSLGTLFLIGRSFLASGSPGLLLLECGVVLWSLSGTVGDAVSHGDANVNVTIFNTGILLAGMCHLAGAILALRPQRAFRAKGPWLGTGCVLSLAALWLIAWAALAHRLPVFFVPGQGGTTVRYCVLMSAIALFVLSAGLLYAGPRATRPAFTSWYALALLLLAVGLFGVMIQLSLGSVVNWLGRTGQWLGGVYLLLAAVGALRESRLRLLPAEDLSRAARYRDAIAVVAVLVAGAVRLVFLQVLGTRAAFITFYPAVMVAALYGGRRGGLLATVLSAIVADYLWIEPAGSLSIVQAADWLALVIFILSGAMISAVTEAMHRASIRAIAAETQVQFVAERERATEAMRQVAEQRQMALDAARLGWWDYDPASGQVVWDKQFKVIFGVSEEQLEYERVIAIMHPDDRERVNQAVRQAIDPALAKPYDIEYRVVWPDGSVRWVVAKGQAYFEGEGPQRRAVRFLGTVMDVTDRKQAEETLRGSEERFKALASATFEGIVISEQGRYIDVNEQLLQMLGYSREELIGRELASEIPPEDRDRALRGLRAGRESRGEHALIRKDGTRIMVEVHGRTADYQNRKVRFTAIRDITQRQQAEEVARRYELLAGQSRDTILFVSRDDGRIVEANAAAVTAYGYSREELLALTIYELRAAQTRPLTASQLAEADLNGILFETVHRRKDGSCVPVEVSSRGATIGSRRLLVSVVRDISERKREEQMLAAAKLSAERARADAEAASKAKDDFLAILSHELRNPLNPVLATASMLRNDPRFDADTREQLEIIHRNAELEARLIDDLLDVTRIERGKIELHKQPVELSTIMRHAAEVCMPDIEARKLEFGIEIPDQPYMVEADPARLQQVFWNLIKNAVKFTPVGGCVGIRCRRDGEGHVLAEVNDSGEGIAPELLPRLFNAFEQGGRQTTRQFGGLGLGLAISKAIVQLHDGTLTADSEGKGKGATFTLRLPLIRIEGSVGVRPATPDEPSAVALTSPLRILLVEDHGDTARVMRRLLSDQGHEVQFAADVTTALKLAAEYRFDLLLSDLGLPDGSGHDLMRALRARGLRLPAIALSGYGQEQDVQQSREAGFTAHLVKPVSTPRLQEEIAKIAGEAGRTAGAG